MTLSEYLTNNSLPEHHLARRQFRALLRVLKEAVYVTGNAADRALKLLSDYCAEGVSPFSPLLEVLDEK